MRPGWRRGCFVLGRPNTARVFGLPASSPRSPPGRPRGTLPTGIGTRRIRRMRIGLGDPPAYTPPYDRCLAAALARAGAEVGLWTSAFAHGAVPAADGYRVHEAFYRRSAGPDGGARRGGPARRDRPPPPPPPPGG